MTNFITNFKEINKILRKAHEAVVTAQPIPDDFSIA